MEQTIKIIKFCRDIPEEIKINNQIIKDLENQYYLPSFSGGLDGMPKAKGKISNITEATALNIPDTISDAIKNLSDENERLGRLYKEIISEIQQLEYREQKVIYEFYIKEFSWNKISNGFYSVRQCKNIRNYAIKKLKFKFEENKQIKYLFKSI